MNRTTQAASPEPMPIRLRQTCSLKPEVCSLPRMSVSNSEFWRLAIESRLLAPADCERLDAKFASVKGAASQSNASTLAEWLVANRALTRYQTRTLLAGKPARFFYNDYYVYDRIRSKEGRLAGVLRAVHLPTHHPVMLYLITGVAADDPQWWHVAVQQIAWACSVGHPFVAQCYQLFETGRHKIAAIEDLLCDSPVGVERSEGKADKSLAARFMAAPKSGRPMLAAWPSRRAWVWRGCISWGRSTGPYGRRTFGSNTTAQ